jgi:cytochrome P450
LHGAAPTLEQLDQLPLLDRVIQETLRVLPVVPLSGRTVLEPVALGKYHLPRFTEVIYSQYITHHMPELYPQPEKFLPDRWLRISPSPYEFLPYGGGARLCLGQTFGLIEVATVLAMIVQRFRLELPPGIRVDRRVGLTMSPRRGLPLLLASAKGGPSSHLAHVRGNVREMVDLP